MKWRRLVGLALLALFVGLPLAAQDSTPRPVSPLGDPLAEAPANVRPAAAPTPTLDAVDGAASGVFGILSGTGSGTSAEMAEVAVAILRDGDGVVVGEALISALTDDLMLVQVSASGLSHGFHGLSIRTIGTCDPGGVTLSASAGPHPASYGELPALYVTRSGLAGLASVADAFTMADLFDADGNAFVIHQQADMGAMISDLYSGDSVAPIACGMFEPSQIPAG